MLLCTISISAILVYDHKNQFIKYDHEVWPNLVMPYLDRTLSKFYDRTILDFLFINPKLYDYETWKAYDRDTALLSLAILHDRIFWVSFYDRIIRSHEWKSCKVSFRDRWEFCTFLKYKKRTKRLKVPTILQSYDHQKLTCVTPYPVCSSLAPSFECGSILTSLFSTGLRIISCSWSAK